MVSTKDDPIAAVLANRHYAPLLWVAGKRWIELLGVE
jgi:hypothetical protein